MVEELRGMAYNPINDKGSPAGGTVADGQLAPEALRQELYSAAGLPSFYGINIMEINEMGVNQRYNKLFDAILTI